ncbi:nuclear transport factor 2 family protein [Novosphingobium sp. 9U]|uniref:nuclear transport factor 2 family protein n=1 Tax=Novosphingobium sp. 9U TaxID=2653158 RepID=UPI0012EFB367|nr:nuclear transport factor 2 family protein [Novosphingobium sp. 9U]VWX49585.1 putative Bile acid 7-alpha dehydratase [Novosphingobium sp. 9U]
MTEIERLLAIEAIKTVKAKYFYGLDHKDWDLWRQEVFASDATLHVPEARPEPWLGIESIIAWVSASTADQVSVHHGHMPIIDFTSDSTASGIWTMEDRLYRTREHPLEGGHTYLHGFGHYRERYVLTDRGWRIHSTQLTRLRVELQLSQ